MAHPLYAVGLLDQAPLLLVVADAGVSNVAARLRYWELIGSLSAPGGTAKRPVWSRSVTAGVGYSTQTPQPLAGYTAPSSFEGRHAYGVLPDVGASSVPFPTTARNGFGQRVRFPEGCGPVFYDSCHLAVQADATANWSWTATIHFEEL